MPEEEKEKIEVFQDGIKPQGFKHLIGQGHPEFQTGQQQDASEYLHYLLDKIKDGERKAKRDNPCTLFDFEMEDRFEC